MICPKCQTENRDDANFCNECGADLRALTDDKDADFGDFRVDLSGFDTNPVNYPYPETDDDSEVEVDLTGFDRYAAIGDYLTGDEPIVDLTGFDQMADSRYAPLTTNSSSDDLPSERSESEGALSDDDDDGQTSRESSEPDALSFRLETTKREQRELRKETRKIEKEQQKRVRELQKQGAVPLKDSDADDIAEIISSASAHSETAGASNTGDGTSPYSSDSSGIDPDTTTFLPGISVPSDAGNDRTHNNGN